MTDESKKNGPENLTPPVSETPPPAPVDASDVAYMRSAMYGLAKASPWLPPEHMRRLPADLVTKDPASPAQVHELDPPHVVGQLVEDYEARQRGEDPDAPPPRPTLFKDKITLEDAPLGVVVPLNQERIDIVRFRVIRTAYETALALMAIGRDVDLSLKHLWFPQDNINVYELRPGAAPGNSLRPRRLQNYKLEIDLLAWPQSIMDKFKAAGLAVPDPQARWDEMVQKGLNQRALLQAEREAEASGREMKPWE